MDERDDQDLDDRDSDEQDDDPQPSLFEQLCREAVPPLRIELPDGDDHIVEWTIIAPDSDGVCDLDELTGPTDVIDALLGEDVADDVLDLLDPLPWSHTVELCAQLRGHFALAHLPAGMWQDLVERIDCYGEAIESDLADRGSDLLDWFRGLRPWPQLHRLLARLPAGSRYHAAILDDEDLARDRIEAGIEPADGKALPPLEGETQDRSLLRNVLSALLRIEHATYAVHAGKKAGSPPKALPGPETAEDRLREEIGDREVEDIFDQVAPWWRDTDNAATHPGQPGGFSRSESGLFVPDT